MNKEKFQAAIHYAANAVVDAERNNRNPYREKTIRTGTLAVGMLHLYLGKDCPKAPKDIDPFSEVYGAAMCLAATRMAGNDQWADTEKRGT